MNENLINAGIILGTFLIGYGIAKYDNMKYQKLIKELLEDKKK